MLLLVLQQMTLCAAWPQEHPLKPLFCPCPGIAAFLELVAEPLYILATTRLLFGLRVGVETVATVAKGVVLLALVRGSSGTPPAIAFSWAQTAYAAAILAGYAAFFTPEALAAWRRGRQGARGSSKAGGSWAPDRQLLRVSGAFSLQVRWR